MIIVTISERFPQEFHQVIHDSCLWMVVATGLLLLGLVCIARPHIISDSLSELGFCTDLEAVTLDQQYPEQMASAARLIVMLIQPVLVVRVVLVDAGYPAVVLCSCITHSVHFWWLLYCRPDHARMILWLTFLVCVLCPLRMGIFMFVLEDVQNGYFPLRQWDPVFLILLVAGISTVLHSSLERHLGPLCCLSAATFLVSDAMPIRLMAVALVIISSALLVLKIHLFRSSIIAHQTVCHKAQYRAMHKLRDTMDHQVPLPGCV